MAYCSEFPAYEVTVEGSLVAPGHWLVHGRVSYRPHPAAGLPGDVETEARANLVAGIIRESWRGREARARTVHVLIEGDSELAGLFRLRPAVPAR